MLKGEKLVSVVNGYEEPTVMQKVRELSDLLWAITSHVDFSFGVVCAVPTTERDGQELLYVHPSLDHLIQRATEIRDTAYALRESLERP